MSTDTDGLKDYIAPEVYEAINRFGFDKVAAAVYGVEAIDEKVATEIIGRRLMERTAEQKLIRTGLAALKELERTE